jgi:hypothetical protein
MKLWESDDRIACQPYTNTVGLPCSQVVVDLARRVPSGFLIVRSLLQHICLENEIGIPSPLLDGPRSAPLSICRKTCGVKDFSGFFG